jgi:DNA (cytosine-5)-methyltransferase 1
MRNIRPKIALFENVPGLFNSDGGFFFSKILLDISQSGYAAEWQIISAKEVGACHLRKRIWIVAHPNGLRFQKNAIQKRDFNKKSQKRAHFARSICGENWEVPVEYALRDDDGIPKELDRYKCCGNAIVPQCAEKIMRLPAFDRWRVLDDTD